MADILPNEAAEQPAAGFEQFDTVALSDGLADDRLALRGIYLALWGLQDLGAEERDLDAISDMIRRLEKRLDERANQLEELTELLDAQDDEKALRTPGQEYRHRDAGLMDAWKQWQATMQERLEAPNHLPDDEEQRLDRAIDEAEARIEGMYARTPLGLAVKLRYLFHEMELSRPTQRALVYGEAITDDMLRDGRERFGWSVVQMAERLARPVGSA